MRILHAADLHLDSAFAALSPEKARQRRRESREILQSLSALAKKESVDLVLLSGDLFDGERVFPETIELLKTSLEQMKCPVCIAPGNHDPFLPSCPYAQETWPKNVYIFRSEKLTAVSIERLGCVVHGAAFVDYHRYSQALSGFSASQDGKIHLLCLHGAVNEPDSAYGPITKQQLADCGCSYAALGHIHRYSGVQMEGSCTWVYPGCPEGRGFDETDEKGAVIAEVSHGQVEVRFVPLCRRQYRILRVDVTDSTPAEALERVLPPTASEDIYRVIFTGEVGERGIDLRVLEETLSHRFYSLELRDETRVAQDIWSNADEDSLRGLFLGELRTRFERAKTQEEKDRIIAAVRFGLAAMDGRDIG